MELLAGFVSSFVFVSDLFDLSACWEQNVLYLSACYGYLYGRKVKRQQNVYYIVQQFICLAAKRNN